MHSGSCVEGENRESGEKMTWDRVSVQTAPTERALSLDDAKCHLRVDTDIDDALILRLIRGAEAVIDGPNGIGYALRSQTWRLSLDCFPAGGTIILPGAPIKSVTSVNYVDTAGTNQTVVPANYKLDVATSPVRLAPAFGLAWPGSRAQNGAVWIDYVVGESLSDNIDAAVIDALALLIGHRYENREATSVASLSDIPFGVESILGRFRQSAVAA